MAQEHTDNSLASSLTDLMTSLAVIFVLLLVASLNNVKQEGEMTRNAILLRLQQELEKELRQYQNEGFEVRSDPKDPLSLIVIVPEGLLNFQINRSDIPEAGVSFLRAIVPKMAGLLCSPAFRSEIASIVVEGHTDTTGTDVINLPLSQSRSLSVVTRSLAILDSAGLVYQGDPSLKSCFLELLAATGRGSVEPYYRDGKIDLDRSRRVVFKVRVRSLEQRILEKLVQVPSDTLAMELP